MYISSIDLKLSLEYSPNMGSMTNDNDSSHTRLCGESPEWHITPDSPSIFRAPQSTYLLRNAANLKSHKNC